MIPVGFRELNRSLASSVKEKQKRRAPRAFGCRRLLLGAGIVLGLLCSLPYIVTSPELHWQIDSSFRQSIITPEPADSRSDLIAFICDLPKSWDEAIYTIQADGSNLRQIHARPSESYRWLSWSPDGNWLATVASNHSTLTTPTGSFYELYRIRFDGLDSRRLTYNRFKEFNPRWSGDGKSVSFASEGAIHRISIDGHKISQSHDPSIKPHFLEKLIYDWSSDGEKLVIADSRGSLLYSTNPDGSALQSLVKAERRISAVDWAANDEQILFIKKSLSRDRSTLTVFDVTSKVDDVTFRNGIYSDAQWSPDGKWIAIVGRLFDEQKGWHLYLLDLTSGEIETVLTVGLSGVISFSWSSDSEWIAFTKRTPSFEIRQIFKIKRDGTGLQQLAEMDCHISELSWSPK